MSKSEERYREQKNKKYLTDSKDRLYIHLNPMDDNVYPRAQAAFAKSKLIGSGGLLKRRLSFLEKKIKDNYSSSFSKAYGNFDDIMQFLDVIKADTQKAIKDSDIDFTLTTTGERQQFRANVFDKNIGKTVEKDVTTALANLLSWNTSENKATAALSDLFITQKNDKQEEILTNYSKYLGFVNKLLKETEITFNDVEIQKFVNGWIKKNEGKIDADIESKIFVEAYDKFIKSGEGKFIVETKQKNLKANSTVKKYATRLKTYTELMKALDKTLGLKEDPGAQRLVQGLAYRTGKTINSLGGYMYEPIIENIIQEAANGILSTLKSVEGGTKDVKIESIDVQKAMQTGKKARTTTKSKPDVRLFTKKNEVGVEIELPGISIKAFTPKDTETHQKILVRSDATIKEIYGLSVKNQREKQYLAANVLSQKGVKGMPQGLKGLTTRYLAAAHSVYALSGTLGKSDTAYFMVLNKKVLTMKDIFNSLIDGTSYMEGNLKSPGSFQQYNIKLPTTDDKSLNSEVAELRSSLILENYLKAKMDIQLHLNTSML